MKKKEYSNKINGDKNDKKRSYRNNIFIKAILLLMALSFVLWGVGSDFSLHSNNWLLKIEDEKYSLDDWHKAIKSEINRIRVQNHDFASGEHARNDIESIKPNLLETAVNSMVLLQEAKKMGLVVSDRDVKKQIAAMPIFHNENKEFDKQKLEQILKVSSMDESMLVEKVREDMLKNQLISLFFSKSKEGMLSQLANLFLQPLYSKKHIKLYTMYLPDHLVQLEQPSKRDVQDFIVHNENLFYIPEKRSISLTFFSLKDIDKSKTIPTDAEIKDYYLKNRFMYIEPEKRELGQMIFKNKSDAYEAYRQIVEEGTESKIEGEAPHSFDITKNKFWQKLKVQKSAKFYYLDMGFVDRSQFNEKISNLIFHIKDGHISKPLYTPMGWTIFIVKNIKVARTKDLEEVRSYIESQLKNEKAHELLNNMVKDLNEKLEFSEDKGNSNTAAANGMDFVAAARECNLRVHKLNDLIMWDFTKADEKVDDQDDFYNQKNNIQFMKDRFEKLGFSTNLMNDILYTAFHTDLNQNSVVIPSRNEIEGEDVFFALNVDSIIASTLMMPEEIEKKALNIILSNRREELKSQAMQCKYRATTSSILDALSTSEASSSASNLSALSLPTSFCLNKEQQDLRKYLDRIKLSTKKIIFNPMDNEFNTQHYDFAMLDRLNRVVFELDLGKFTQPIKENKDIYSFLYLENIEYFVGKDFEDIYNRQQGYVENIYNNLILEEYLAALRKKYKIEVNYANL